MKAFILLLTAGFLPAQQPFKPAIGNWVPGDPGLKEASGMAVSNRNERFFWFINDSGSKPLLYLAGDDGTARGTIEVEDATLVDWEAMDSFGLDGKPYLLVADTGDNTSTRKSVVLHVIPEPLLPADGVPISGKLKPAWRIPFVFEDGPRDCEAVAVDADAGKILLISKRTDPPQIYELPLRPKPGNQPVVAVKIGSTVVNPPLGIRIPYANQPTGLDLTSDGSLAAVVTYFGVFLFPRSPGESWASAFGRPSVPLLPHGLPQAESLAFSNDGNEITVVSEGAGPPGKHYRR